MVQRKWKIQIDGTSSQPDTSLVLTLAICVRRMYGTSSLRPSVVFSYYLISDFKIVDTKITCSILTEGPRKYRAPVCTRLEFFRLIDI